MLLLTSTLQQHYYRCDDLQWYRHRLTSRFDAESNDVEPELLSYAIIVLGVV